MGAAGAAAQQKREAAACIAGDPSGHEPESSLKATRGHYALGMGSMSQHIDVRSHGQRCTRAVAQRPFAAA